MKVSREIASKVFYALIKKRDNTKGNLTELEWFSFLHTINVINDAILDDCLSVDNVPLSKYYLLSDLEDLILPRVVKHELNSENNNLIDYSIAPGDHEIEESEYSLTARPAAELMAEAKTEEASQDGIDEVKKSKKVKLGKVEVLSPDDFRLIQDVLCQQVKKSAPSYVGIDTLVKSEKIQLQLSSVKTRIVFGNDTFNENEKEGFRPIGMNRAMFPYLNMRRAQGDTSEQFYTWFNNKIFG